MMCLSQVLFDGRLNSLVWVAFPAGRPFIRAARNSLTFRNIVPPSLLPEFCATQGDEILVVAAFVQ